MKIYERSPGEWIVILDTSADHLFTTYAQARHFALTGETLSAADAERKMRMADQFISEVKKLQTQTRVMFDAQQAIFAAVNLLKLRGAITIGAEGVIINKTDAELTALGLDRAILAAGLAALYGTLTGVPELDSAAIAALMD